MPQFTVHAAKTNLSKLIAQAQAEDMVLVSNETLFDSFAVQRLW